MIALLPVIERSTWEALPRRLLRNAIAHIDLLFLWNEFTVEQYVASRFAPHPSLAVHHRIEEELARHVAGDIAGCQCTRILLGMWEELES